MNTKQWMLGAVAMIALAAVVLTGVALTEEYSYHLRSQTTATENGITPLINTSVLVGSTGEYPYLQDLTGCVNASNGLISLDSSNYTVQEGDEDGGYIYLTDPTFNGTAVNCTVTYLADTDAQGAADNFSAGLAIFGTFAAVVVLSLVGKIIIGMWTKKE